MEFQVLLLILFLPTFFIFHLFFRRIHPGRLPVCPWPRLPVIGHLHLLGPLVHRSLHRLSLRHGPFFSLHLGSVSCIVVSDPHYAKLFLRDNELSFSSRLESTAIKRLTYETSLAFSPYGPYWKFIKKITLKELVGSRCTGRFCSLRAQECSNLLKLIAGKAMSGEAVNVTEELLKTTKQNNIEDDDRIIGGGRGCDTRGDDDIRRVQCGRFRGSAEEGGHERVWEENRGSVLEV